MHGRAVLAVGSAPKLITFDAGHNKAGCDGVAGVSLVGRISRRRNSPFSSSTSAADYTALIRPTRFLMKTSWDTLPKVVFSYFNPNIEGPKVKLRSISEREIALIKAMLARGLKNKDIQFFFNRPDRPVNTGRISTIRSGSYSNSSQITAASEHDLEDFLLSFDKSTQSTKGQIEATIAERARAFFRKSKDGMWSLEGGESEGCECKKDFDPKKMTAIVKAVAALANNKGGYIFFGVSDAGFKVEGVGSEFSKTDIVRIVEKVKAHLSPTPTITAKQIIDFDGLPVGLLHVAKYPNPPIIVYRDGDGLNEGEIFEPCSRREIVWLSRRLHRLPVE